MSENFSGPADEFPETTTGRRLTPRHVRRAISYLDASVLLMPVTPLVIAAVALAETGSGPLVYVFSGILTLAVIAILPLFAHGVRGRSSASSSLSRRLPQRLPLARLLRPMPLSVRVVAAAAGFVLTVGTLGSAILVLQPDLPRSLILGFVPTSVAIMLGAAFWRPRTMMAFTVVSISAMSVLLTTLRAPHLLNAELLGLIFLLIGVGLLLWATVWTTLWLRTVLIDLDTARSAESQLAVAEERLRFSRDLHDVLGRRMSHIAVQSELISVLARQEAGPDSRAAEAAHTVRGVAVESLDEIRALVRGYRSIDVHAELTGARRLLASAGIRVAVSGNPDDLPVHLHTTVAWVIREAVTNILRHSDAEQVTVTFTPQSVEIRNERSTPAEESETREARTASAATGLVGLGERVAAAHGKLSAQHTATGFRLLAQFSYSPFAPPSSEHTSNLADSSSLSTAEGSA